ncbi:hypothetical protein M378DRAFT_26563 [Amanita muscaria Koide BX008]|uniref:Nucleoporin protein Ndc1-Nup n=1 Tax=Amanita muscaria (strain Koide BX008) TaxID=946122 RepID=A0A0C2WU94_AMAMK|nr:hypothetical protein M378DRAFT_26563 [Amanita muscaria Koide BX008]
MAIMSSSTSSAAPQIRAIHTSLTSRPVPSIPPPTQIYVPLTKQILRHRLIRQVFVSSLLSCWALSTVWGTEKAESRAASALLLTPFRLKTILWTAIMWGALALPEVVLRKRFLTSKPTKAASPQGLVNEARKKGSTKIALVTYLVSAACFLVLHIAFVEGGDHRLRLFVKSKKHPFYVNPRFIYLLFSQLVVASVYSLRTILLDRFVFKLSQSTSTTTAKLVTLPTLLQTIFISTLLSTLTFPLTSLLVLLSRLIILPLLYHVPLLSQLLKPFTAHFLKTPLFSLSHPISSLIHTILLPLTHFPLVFRSCAIAFTTLFTWEIASTFFSASISQPIKVSHLVADPNLVLVSGISVSSFAETDGFPFHYSAYLELRDLASASDSPQASAQRSALFADQKYTPSLWSRLVRESLLLLGKDYQLLLHRGNPPATPAPAASAASSVQAASSLPFQVTPVKLISQPSSAFKPVQGSPMRSVVDSLASDGPLAKAVDLVNEEAETVASKVPELFRSVRGAVGPPSDPRSGSGASGGGPAAIPTAIKEGLGSQASTNSPELVTRAKAEIRTRLDAVVKEITNFVPEWVKQIGYEVHEWWTREREHRKVEVATTNKEVDLVVFDVLSHFVCASLTEDTFGVVQRDIPKILEAMVKFLGEMEGWRAQLAASTPSPSIPASSDHNSTQIGGQDAVQELSLKQIRAQQELDSAKALLSEPSDGLKEGIGRVVRTFGDKLTAFRFPPTVAKSLQGFLDYCT